MVVTRAIGIHGPGLELLIVRLIQAAYSVLVVYFLYGYRKSDLARATG